MDALAEGCEIAADESDEDDLNRNEAFCGEEKALSNLHCVRSTARHIDAFA